jgi:uncharacterized membrane protein
MKQALAFITRSLFSGLLVLVPIYLAILLLLKGMKSVVGLVRPFALLLPDWLPAEMALSLLLVLAICFVTGLAIRTRVGQAARARVERSIFERLPGYTLVRSLTQQMAGKSRENIWRPALFETDEGLMLAFIIEEVGDGRYTVFVPSIPTPFAGAVYIVDQRRVHLLDVPFSEAVKTVSRWGSGARDLVAAMERVADARSAGPTPAAELV